jgi:hypothetical protein
MAEKEIPDQAKQFDIRMAKSFLEAIAKFISKVDKEEEVAKN